MGLIEKLETLINTLLFKLGELLWKFMPSAVKKFFVLLHAWKTKTISWIKKIPGIIIAFCLHTINKFKSSLTTINFKEVFTESYGKALEKYKSSSGSIRRIKSLFLAPVLVVGKWLQGLSASQALLLMTFTAGSILSVIGIGFSGQKLVGKHLEADRAPASVEEEITYDRKAYYKKETKHFDMNAFRLPVYIAELNEVRTVDIDFTATLSNRNSRMFLEKHEFQLRDHLILQVEPSVASFPLEEEGKEIIRKKLWAEVSDFLKLHGIEGEVTEMKITYLLAN
jgi:flagellar basal body-associated protein FliL